MAGMISPAFAPVLVGIHEPGVACGQTTVSRVGAFNTGLSAGRLSQLCAEEPQENTAADRETITLAHERLEDSLV